MNASKGTPAKPIFRLKRPSLTNNGDLPTILGHSDYSEFLASIPKSRRKTSPIYLEATSNIEGNWDEPLVADESMFTGGVVNGSSSFSPRALISDKWHDLSVTVTDPVTLTSAAPTATAGVTGVDRNIPKGFVFNFLDGSTPNLVMVAEETPSGASSIALTRIYSDVNIPDNTAGNPNPGYYYQNGTGCPKVSNQILVGNPNPYINNPRVAEPGRAYSCDAIAVNAMGAIFENLYISNFAGHGLRVGSATNSDSYLGPGGNNAQTYMDAWEVRLGGIINIQHCLTGVTINAADATFETIVAGGFREYGLKLNGPNIQGTKCHCWGGILGIWCELGGSIQHIEGENCDYGANLFFIPQEIGTIKVWGNRYRGLFLGPYDTVINTIHAEHTNSETTSVTDPSGWSFPTGWAIVVKDFCDNLICPNTVIRVGSGAQGCQIGTDVNHDLTGFRMKGGLRSLGSPGSKGLYFKCNMVGSEIDFNCDNDFETAVYFADRTFAGNRIRLRGASGTTIWWPGASEVSTFADEIPSGMAAANDIKISTY